MKVTSSFPSEGVDEVEAACESVTSEGSCVLSTTLFLSGCARGVTFGSDEISGLKTLLNLAVFRIGDGRGLCSKSNKSSHRDNPNHVDFLRKKIRRKNGQVHLSDNHVTWP